jgi:NitT/TauT family transport system permease protein
MSQTLRVPQSHVHWTERIGWSVASLAVLVALWSVLAAIAQNRHGPGPLAVLDVVIAEAKSGVLWAHLSATLARVIASFVVAMLIGSAIGLALGRNEIANKFFDAWLILFLNLPALVIIALCYVWLGTWETTAITAVALNKIPNVAVQMREGARSLSRDLDEMAFVYKLGWMKTFRNVTIPQLGPFFAAAARSGLALVWKIVLVVEALGGHSKGVGHQIFTAFQSFDVPVILAYALAFIVVIQAFEWGVLQPMQAHLNRWKR